jgi:hypothetical protein
MSFAFAAATVCHCSANSRRVRRRECAANYWICARAPEDVSEKTAVAFHSECHFECHCAGKTRKRKVADETGRKKLKVLNCFGGEA